MSLQWGAGLRKLAFEAQRDEVTVVLGRNGVGKTTLLKSLMGVVPVKTGSVMLAGINIIKITKATPYERVRRGVGHVPQGREVFSRLTASTTTSRPSWPTSTW